MKTSQNGNPSDPKSFFQVIAQEAIMGIMAFCAKERKCLYINRLAREALELDLPEASVGEDFIENSNIPLKLDDLFPIEARAGFARPFSDEFLRHEGLSQDVIMRKQNGLPLIANVGIKKVPLEGGVEAVLVMFQDITVQKKLQREVHLKQEEIHKAYTELLEQNRQLKELDHAKDRFVALTTHELRTPLAAIVATAEVLVMELYESPEQKDAFIKTIHEQSLHLMELVNDVLDFAKIRAGKMEFYIERLDVGALVTKLVEGYDRMAAQSQVRIEVKLPSEPVHVYGDVLRLKEVVNNVVNNAIKYNRPGGEVVVSVSAPNEGRARITVRDTGYGIPSDKLEHVFNEFETVGAVSRHHKGTGLGMPIAKQLVQAMGGDLSLESREGVGSSFFIDVPTEKVLGEEMYRERPDTWSDFAA